jgi:hypothetical protein
MAQSNSEKRTRCFKMLSIKLRTTNFCSVKEVKVKVKVTLKQGTKDQEGVEI